MWSPYPYAKQGHGFLLVDFPLVIAMAIGTLETFSSSTTSALAMRPVKLPCPGSCLVNTGRRRCIAVGEGTGIPHNTTVSLAVFQAAPKFATILPKFRHFFSFCLGGQESLDSARLGGTSP